jgi:hypothetical protein
VADLEPGTRIGVYRLEEQLGEGGMGVVFRATREPEGDEVALKVLRAFDWQGDFDNLGDTADGLRRILEESFETVEVDVVGSTADFTATRPRPGGKAT